MAADTIGRGECSVAVDDDEEMRYKMKRNGQVFACRVCQIMKCVLEGKEDDRRRKDIRSHCGDRVDRVVANAPRLHATRCCLFGGDDERDRGKEGPWRVVCK